MKITIIAPFTFGYIDTLVERLRENPSVQVTFINFNNFTFRYNSTFERISNFYLKSFKKRNLKKEFYSGEIWKIVNAQPHQNCIMIIRPDKLTRKLLLDLSSKTSKLISYFFDGIENFPEKIDLLPLFNEVYTYDKTDAKNFNLNFNTNYIPNDIKNPSGATTRGVFNISSFDERFSLLERLSKQLTSMGYPFRFIVRKKKVIYRENIAIVSNYLPLEEVKKYIEEAEILLDIQKENQSGLSFRVFEALGYEKKLITTNEDVKTYDFYDPNNILVIDKKDLQIPESFLKNPYRPVAEKIKSNYRRDAWIKKVLGVE